MSRVFHWRHTSQPQNNGRVMWLPYWFSFWTEPSTPHSHRPCDIMWVHMLCLANRLNAKKIKKYRDMRTGKCFGLFWMLCTTSTSTDFEMLTSSFKGVLDFSNQCKSTEQCKNCSTTIPPPEGPMLKITIIFTQAIKCPSTDAKASASEATMQLKSNFLDYKTRSATVNGFQMKQQL